MLEEDIRWGSGRKESANSGKESSQDYLRTDKSMSTGPGKKTSKSTMCVDLCLCKTTVLDHIWKTTSRFWACRHSRGAARLEGVPWRASWWLGTGVGRWAEGTGLVWPGEEKALGQGYSRRFTERVSSIHMCMRRLLGRWSQAFYTEGCVRKMRERMVRRFQAGGRMWFFMVMAELAQQHREVVESHSLEASETHPDKPLLRCGYSFNPTLCRRLG